MDIELVSVIMPTYNAAPYIWEAIESVMAQTYPKWELLITDDASTDNTLNIISTYQKKDPRISVSALQSNQGSANARNVALSKAKGRYIAFLDSDDIWKNDKLEKQLAFMKQHEHAFTFSAYELIDHTGKQLNKVVKVPVSIDYKHYLRNTIIGCLTVILDKKQIGEIHVPDIRTSQDMALWLSILKKGFKAFGYQEPLANYRLVSGSASGNKWKAAKDVWKVYRKIENLSLFYSLFNFWGYAFHAAKKRL